MANYTRLTNSSASFDAMLRRFGVVTVMNAHVYDFDSSVVNESKNAEDVLSHYYTGTGYIAGGITLDTLKVANVTIEGPTKTVTGGQYSNTLIKFGKTARLEMQDALGNCDAVEMLCGGVIERFGEEVLPLGTDTIGTTHQDVLHVGSDFCGAKTIIGDSFFIDQKSGQQVKVKIIFYQFLPDSVFNLTQDSEGDATVFDMNGDLLTTNISVGTVSGVSSAHGVFYSVLAETGPEVNE